MACHHPQLLADIIAFIAKADRMSEVTFGRKALRDPHFVRDLKNGRQIFATTEGRVREFMRRYEAEAASQSTGNADRNSPVGVAA